MQIDERTHVPSSGTENPSSDGLNLVGVASDETKGKRRKRMAVPIE